MIPDTPTTETQRASAGAADESQFLASLRQRDPLAFETLLDRYEAPVYRFFLYSHGDHDRAQDECGETFAQLVTVIDNLRGGPERLRGFVFGVARNVQRRGWRGVKPLTVTELELLELPDDREPLFQTVSRRQQFEQALQFIQQFDDPARQALLLRYVEELKITEVAEALDLPINTVKSLLHRGCQRLRQLMETDTTVHAGEKL